MADVALLRGVAGARCGIKASGGIRNLDQVRALLEAGANRIGGSGLRRDSARTGSGIKQVSVVRFKRPRQAPLRIGVSVP